MSLFDFNGEDVSRRLHWTTVYTEKVMLSVIGGLTVVAASQSIWGMALVQRVTIADLFLLFIYTEIIGMVGAFFVSSRIPVTLPIIIAMTALCRLIVLHGKDSDPVVVIAEAGAILVLSVAAYIMSLKDARSLKKSMNEKIDKSLSEGLNKNT
ncbi:MAG: phosphate-starvation-inducible PsiE family protein [Pseudomonadota bacterium]|nr:phosphate-starvation-inducible PsiE family protein [Pseudomonadota bacterium]